MVHKCGDNENFGDNEVCTVLRHQVFFLFLLVTTWCPMWILGP